MGMNDCAQSAYIARRQMMSGAGQYTHELWRDGTLMYRAESDTPPIHDPKPKMRPIGDAWMCYSRTHAAVEPTAEAAYKRWEGML
jgi:hypothetical protein